MTMMAQAVNTCAFLVFLVLFVFINLCLCNDKPGTKDEEYPFRRQKINMLWAKAQNKLSSKLLKDLRSDLKVQDKEEISWKKHQAMGKDEDGLQAAELRQKLKGIMMKYGLFDEGKYLLEDSMNMEEDLSVHRKPSKVYNSVLDKLGVDGDFQDERLQKLWDKAQKAGFSDNELRDLHTEFEHHQEKVDEYYSLMNSVEDGDLQENTIQSGDKQNLKQQDIKHASLKHKNRIIEESFAKLNDLASFDKERGEFKQEKVKHLWGLAEKANFTKSELLSLKEELKHFEHKLDKLNYIMSKDVESESKTLKTDDYKRKVDKLHRHLETKIVNKHNEL